MTDPDGGRSKRVDVPAPGGGTKARPPSAGLRHMALFYSREPEYVAGVAGFVREGLAREDAALVIVPAARAAPLRDALGADAWRVAFADMAELGRNPGRIIPAVLTFAARHAGQAISYVGEPAFAGRPGPELLEATKHEALVNLAFAGAPATILCPYDESRLPASVVADAHRTHPVLVRRARQQASSEYLSAGQLPPSCQQPLPAPPPAAQTLSYRADLRPLREAVGRAAAAAGLGPGRGGDLMLAVSEVAANTLRHTGRSGTRRIWRTPAELCCEVSDDGWITDPLAGRIPPREDQPSGQGLWLVNQVCDLVQIRSGPLGTTVRLQMSLVSGR